jgi:hypothetical protein
MPTHITLPISSFSIAIFAFVMVLSAPPQIVTLLVSCYAKISIVLGGETIYPLEMSTLRFSVMEKKICCFFVYAERTSA